MSAVATGPRIWCGVHFNARAVSPNVLECFDCKRLGPPKIGRLYAWPLGLALRAAVLGHTGAKSCDNCVNVAPWYYPLDAPPRPLCLRVVRYGNGNEGGTMGPYVDKVPAGTRPDNCPGWSAMP